MPEKNNQIANPTTSLDETPSMSTIVSLVAYFIILSIVLTAALLFTWAAIQDAIGKVLPDVITGNIVDTIGSKSMFSAKLITVGDSKLVVIPDSLAIIAVFASGAFGGLIHSIRSFYYHITKGDLKKTEVIKYTLRPFSGAILALIFFLVVRAGMGHPTPDDIGKGSSIVFYTAIGALVGMFTDQTVEKLKKVAEAILSTPTK